MAITQENIESLAEDYYEEIYGYCFARMLRKRDVEDVVQSVFLTLQEKQAELEPEHLRAWLYSVAHKKLMEKQLEQAAAVRAGGRQPGPGAAV